MKMLARASAVRLGAALILAACSSPFGPVWAPALTTDATSYSPGSTISATLVNRTGGEIVFGACPFSFERRVGGEWTNVPQPDHDCDSSLQGLNARRTTTLQVSPAAPQEPGTYRLVMGISSGTADRTTLLRSPQFVIRSGS